MKGKINEIAVQNQPKEWESIAVAVRLLGRSREELMVLIHNGELPFAKFGVHYKLNIPLAISQGSKNHTKFYTNYSRLVNSTLKISGEKRDSLPYHYLTTIDLLERIIENIISAEVDKETPYKEIYEVCKAKCKIAAELSFLPKLQPLLAG